MMKNIYTGAVNGGDTRWRGLSFSFLLKLFLTTLAILAFNALVNAQALAVTQNANSQTLAQLLTGSGVTISNYTLSCNSNGTGTFTNNSSNLGIPGGVALSSGKVTSIPASAIGFASSAFTLSGDAQLSTLTGGNIYDPCVLEFDVVPQGPVLRFNYVFASEEYPEFVCSQYNDVFGFFISGPNPAGGNFNNVNIATIPGGTMPVAINTVNGGTSGTYSGTTWPAANCPSLSNTAYYRDNRTPTVNANIVYDGMTTVLQATSPVIPCRTYHLKIAIADVGDRIYDSGVFLDAYSFTSPAVTITASAQLNIAGYSSAYEGCVGGTFTLTLSQAQSIDLVIPIIISGTATNGTDYTAIPSSVTVPAGQLSATIAVTPLTDGITESPETVSIAITDPCTGGISSSATLTMQDDIPSSITVSDTTLCSSQSAQLTATGGLTYTWSPATGLSNPNISNPIATPTVTTTYTVNMVWGSCTKTKSATVYVSNPVLNTVSVPGSSVCNGGTVDLSVSVSGGASPYSYLWNNGAITPSITIATGGTYTVTSTDAYGCTSSISQPVVIANLSMTGATTNVSCMGGSNGAIDITVTGTNAPFTYSWNGGSSSQDRTNLVAGTYSVTVSNTVGCSVSASYTITQPASNLTTSATNTPVSCNGGSNGTITLTPNGGVGPYSYLWSNGAVTKDLSGITSGSYSVTVTDNNGCTASRTVNITQASAISTSETHVNTTCFGGSTGSIDLTVSGGVTPYTYNWNEGSTTQDINSIRAGSYMVSVADANSCVVTRTVVISEPTAVSVVASGTNPSCFGTSTGSVSITVSGGTPGYTYVWSNGPATQNISSLSTGTFRVTVSDNNLCSATASATLTQPTVLSASTAKTNVTCNGGNNGAITLTATGGTAPYSYNWGSGVVTQNRTALTAGTYTVTVTDNSGCTATASATLTQPTAIAVLSIATGVSCNGGSNGSINITPSGGTSPYTFNWGGVTTEDRAGLSAGTYTVTVTDTRGCTGTSTSTVSQPALLTFSETHTDVTCSGGNNGTINVTLGGGTSPYTYNWGGGVTTQNRTALTTGTYNLTGTDSRGCTVTGSATIAQPGPINIASVVTDATCAPGNNGAINLTTTGGTSPYSFDWGGGTLTQNRTALFAGTYTVTVTDNIGCTASKAISVTQIGIGMSLSATHTDALCFGSSDGTIDLTVTGGNPPINYDWGSGIITEDRTGLAPGNYSVTVTDGLGCSAISNSNIAEPTSISISVTKTDVRCFGESTGSITTTVSGGTPGYTYDWGSGITTPNITAIPAGSYTVVVADANACSATAAAIIIGQPATAVNLSAVSSNVSCFGEDNGSINLTASGGSPAYTYSWSNGSISQDLNNIVSGTYTVTATDANTCSATLTSVVTQPSPAVTVVLVPTDLSCNGNNTGAITTTVSGGTPSYTYVWDDATVTQNRTALAAGNYSVTVTDNNGCTSTATTSVSEPNVLSVTSTPVNVSCNGGSNGAITLSVTGGTGAYGFNWGGGITTQNRTSLSAGTYNVTVTDVNACSASTSQIITQPTALTLALNTGSSVCASATGTTTAVTNNTGTSPYSYLWSNGGNTSTLTGLAPGSFSVSVTDANGCSISGSVVVNLSGNNTDASFSVAGNYCGPNATVNFTHTGSSNIITHGWDFGDGLGTSAFNSPTYTFPNTGTFTVTHIVTRGFCADTVTSPLTINQKPVLSSVVTTVSCFGTSTGAIDLSVTGSPAFTYSWTTGAITQDISGLALGTYDVTVTDANSCSSSLTASVTQPPVLAITNTNTNVSCFGGSDGDITLTVVGGTPAYSYNWGSGVITQNRTGLAGGTYIVTVTDANSCSSSKSIAVYEPNAVNIAVSAANVSCNGMSNGSISLTVTGGTGSYNYLWNGGLTTQNRNGLTNGTYTVTVSDSKSCSASATATITQPTSVSVALTPFNVACFGASTGSIQSLTTGGIAPYVYSWSDGSSQVNRSGISAGVYSVTIVDQNSCSVSATTTLTQPATAVNVVVDNTTPVLCNGNNTGTINITATGGVPGYAYLWSDNSNLEDRTNMLAGTYFVTASDQQGCIATVSATINEPSAPLNIDTIVAVDVVCFGSATGSITTTVSGGTTPYNYSWTGGITSANLVNVVAGNYDVSVTDANGCSTSASAVIAQPATGLSATATTTNVACFGGTNGDITVSVSGGVSPYSFNWGGGVTTQNRTNLAAGTYSVIVTDMNSCTTSTGATVTQPLAALSATASATNISCFGGNNGTISLTVTGGTAAYTYLWSDNSNLEDRTNMLAGTYFVTASDQQGCIATVSATINEPSASLNIDAIVAVDVACFGAATGSLTTTVSGGTIPYNYSWTGGMTSANLVNIVAGNYDVSVTDANGCSTSATAVIAQPATGLSATATTTNVVCFGGSNGDITLNVSGGVSPYSFNWGGGVTTQNRTNLAAGTYSVIVTDVNSCTTSTGATVTQPLAALSATASATNISCFGGSNGTISLTVTGGTTAYTFDWGSGVTTQNRTNLTAGTYNVIVTDAVACTATASATITQPAAFNITMSNSNVSCNAASDGVIDITVTGGTPAYTYLWNNGATTQDLNNLSAGNYSVIIRDANNCVTNTFTTITQPTGITLGETHTAVLCNGGNSGTITIFVSGGAAPYTYIWNDGATTQNRTNVIAGSYRITVSDATNCAVNGPIVITQPASALSATLTTTNVLCNGASTGAVTTTTSGGTPGYAFAWSDGTFNPTLTNVAAGNYLVTITDANSCSVTRNTVITEPTALNVNRVVTDVACNGASTGSVNLTTSGGTPSYSYLWNSGAVTEDILNVPAGNYGVTISDASGCSVSQHFAIAQPLAIQLSTYAQNTTCYNTFDGAIDLTVTGGVTPVNYVWSNQSTVEDPAGLGAGYYFVLVTDNNGCTATTSAVVASPTEIHLNENHRNITCNGAANGVINLAVSGGTPGYQFNWSNTAVTQNIFNLNTGTFNVTVTDANGCMGTLSGVVITEPSVLSVTVVATDVACANENMGSVDATINGGTTPYSYVWNNNAHTEDLTNVPAGAYALTVTDANSCTQTACTLVNTLPQMDVKGTADQLPCQDAKGGIDLTVSSGAIPYSILWSNGATTEDVGSLSPGIYSVSIRDANGCAFDTSFVIVNENTFSVSASGGGTVKLGETIDLHAYSSGSDMTVFSWTPTYNTTCPSCATITVQPSQFTTYTVVAVDTNGCMSQDTVSVDVIKDHTIFTPNAFTPNGDGNNDFFQLYGNLAGIREFSVMIFNRWGEKVYDADQATFAWDGMYKGETVPPGVFVYVMKVGFMDAKTNETLKGSLTVVR